MSILCWLNTRLFIVYTVFSFINFRETFFYFYKSHLTGIGHNYWCNKNDRKGFVKKMAAWRLSWRAPAHCPSPPGTAGGRHGPRPGGTGHLSRPGRPCPARPYRLPTCSRLENNAQLWLWLPKIFFVPPILISVVEPEPTAEEPKLNCLLEPEPKLRIAAPAPFYLWQTWRNFIEKIMVAEEIFVNCYNFNPFSQVKKKAIFKKSYKTILLSRGGAGAERNNFCSTKLIFVWGWFL